MADETLTCEWCQQPLPPGEPGSPVPQFCSEEHFQLALEQRTKPSRLRWLRIIDRFLV